jgi:hypothetical protein
MNLKVSIVRTLSRSIAAVPNSIPSPKDLIPEGPRRNTPKAKEKTNITVYAILTDLSLFLIKASAAVTGLMKE